MLGGAEAEREPRQRRRDEDQPKGGDRGADEGSDGGDPQGHAPAPLQRHLVAVEGRHDGGRLSGRVQQHGGDGAPVHRAVIDGGEHDDGAGWIEVKCEGDENRDAGRRSDARKDADELAEHATDQREEKVLRGERMYKPGGQLVE